MMAQGGPKRMQDILNLIHGHDAGILVSVLITTAVAWVIADCA